MSLRTRPPQQRYQDAVGLEREREAAARGAAHGGARRGRQRPALEVGERRGRPRRPGGPAPSIRRPRSSTRRPSAARSGRPAAVDPRQPGRVRAAVGRVDVAAEVVGLGVAGADDRADHARARRGGGRRGRAAEEGAPRGVAPALRRSARSRAAATTEASWRGSFTVPLASTTPSGAERDRERRARARARRPRPRAPRPRRASAPARRPARPRPGATLRHSEQPGLVNSASLSSPAPSNQSASGLARPSGGPSSASSSAPRGALRRPSASTTTAAAAAAVATSGSSGAPPSAGSAAAATASSAVRAAEPRESRPPRPKQPHGAPAFPCASAVTWTSRKPASTSAGGVGRGRAAGRDPGRERGLDDDQRGPDRRREPSGDPERRERHRRAGAVGGLEGCGAEQDRGHQQPCRHGAHRGGNIAMGSEVAAPVALRRATSTRRRRPA